jgi:putative methyltransferase (TIGR04325 family)
MGCRRSSAEIIRAVLKATIPPFLLRWAKSCHDWSLPCRSWEAAAQRATGYDAPRILQRARLAMEIVRANPSLLERDTVVLSNSGITSWPLLASLLWVATRSDGRLTVLDFGGSLGSTLLEYGGFLRYLRDLSWNVVEQPHFVACGRAEFETSVLRFFTSVAECQEQRNCNVFLMSSVLQYLEDPYCELRSLLQAQPPFFILDRTTFHPSNRDCIVVQRSTVARESYPCWFLQQDRVSRIFEENSYDLVWDWPSWEDASFAYPRYRGCLFAKRPEVALK